MSDIVNKCVTDLANRLGTLSREDETILKDRLRGAVKRFIESHDVGNIQNALRKELDKISQEQILAGKIEKRNAYLNFIARQETRAYINRAYKDNPLRGMEALMVGVQSIRQGSRASVGSTQDSLSRIYIGGMMHDLERKNLMEVVSRGTFDEDIADYMFLRDSPDELTQRQFQQEVKDIGEIFFKWQDVARRHANDAGAFIRSMPNYITRQSHDMMKVQRAGFKQWADDIRPRLDLDRMKESIEVREDETLDDALDRYLKNVHEAIAAGDYMRPDSVASRMKGGVNVGRAMSHTRKLHFRSGKDWYDYNRKYGSATLRETVMWNLYKSARNTGLMRVLGPNPRDNMDLMIQQIKSDIDDPGRRGKFLKAFQKDGQLEKYFHNLTGEASTPYNANSAQFWSIVRALETMGKLGGATLSAIADLPIFASEYQRLHGSWLKGLGVGVHSLVRNIGFSKQDQREMAAMMGTFSDAMTGSIAARFGGEQEIPGMVADGVNKFFRLNGLHWWTDSLKQGFVAAMSRQLAMRRGVRFAELPDEVRQTAKMFNIDESDWEIFRASEIFDFRGDGLLTIDGIGRVPDEVVARQVSDEIAKIRARAPKNMDEQIAAAIRKKRDETQVKWQSYFTDRAEHAVITPDRKTQTLLNQGARPGTFMGELIRLVTQFKAFPVTVLQKGIGSQMFRNGVEFDDMHKLTSLGQGFKSGGVGTVKLMMAMSAFGYVALTAKDFLKGRKPRDPMKGTTVRDAFLQGGAGGLLGDMLFNPVPSRVGGGFFGVAAGPALGDISATFDIWQGIMNGEDVKPRAFRQALSLVPGNNLFYVRPALDYLMVHEMNEALSPGYLRRSERRLKRDQGIEYFYSPREAVQ